MNGGLIVTGDLLLAVAWPVLPVATSVACTVTVYGLFAAIPACGVPLSTQFRLLTVIVAPPPISAASVTGALFLSVIEVTAQANNGEPVFPPAVGIDCEKALASVPVASVNAGTLNAGKMVNPELLLAAA